MFCDANQLSPLSHLEAVLCLFIVFLAQQSLTYQSIILHLSGVQSLEIAWGASQWARIGCLGYSWYFEALQGHHPTPHLPQVNPNYRAIMHLLRGV